MLTTKHGASSLGSLTLLWSKKLLAQMMTAPRINSRRRNAPTRHSVLDRRALERALDERSIPVKGIHIDAFYQALHRQHYPTLPDFVTNYEAFEQECGNGVVNPAASAAVQQQQQRPLKNALTAKKNKNKSQLPKSLLDFLVDVDNGFCTMTSKIAKRETSRDGSTIKLAIELYDGQLVESVLMKYCTAAANDDDNNNNKTSRRTRNRASLCVSSQCGCQMGCTFCATGTMGLSGNLTCGEILEQLIHADTILADEYMAQKENNNSNNDNNNDNEQQDRLDLVRNVVFMGMGEPLDNYTNVVEACKAMMDVKRWNLSFGRITVSTVGLVGQIRKLTRELPQVSLALSLHAPNQELRQAIVPTARQYPIERLIDALDNHMMAYVKKKDVTLANRQRESSRRRAMIEYVMLRGPTSSLECAHQLGELCRDRQLLVNLIPYNATDVKDQLQCPSLEHMEEFKRIVASYGAFCTIRKTMGADIASACGQLITREETIHALVPDIEDIAAVSNNEGKATTTTAPPKLAKRDFIETDLFQASAAAYERWILPLFFLTAVAATSFVVSSTLFLRQRRR